MSNNDAATNENMAVETSLVGCGLHIAAATGACRWIFHRTGSGVNENKNIAVIPTDPLSIQSVHVVGICFLSLVGESARELGREQQERRTKAHG